MEPLLVLLGIALVVGLPVGAVMGMIAWSRVGHLTKLVEELQAEVERLRRRPSIPPSTPLANPPTSITAPEKLIAQTVKPVTSATPKTADLSASVPVATSPDSPKTISSSPQSAAVIEAQPLMGMGEIISVSRTTDDVKTTTNESPITSPARDNPQVAPSAPISPFHLGIARNGNVEPLKHWLFR